jgi:hypothetical protein
VASTKPTPSSSRVKNSVPTGEAVADLRRRQEAGELAADLDSARVLLASIAAAIAPVALPQLVRSITGIGQVRDPASLDHLGVLESHRLGDTTGPEERAAGAEHGRDEVQHDLVDQSFAQRLAADVAGGEGDITSAAASRACSTAARTPSATNVNGASPANSQSVGAAWVTT